MERLLTTWYPSLPILLLRPTTIGESHYERVRDLCTDPGLNQPKRFTNRLGFYRVEGSCPLTTFYHIYIDDPGNATWYIESETGRTTGSNIIDVIPVD